MRIVGWIVVTGNPADGFDHTGPFESAQEADEWAEAECKNVSWWVVELYAPT